MKRRSRPNRKRTQQSRFEFAQLEPRKLLAADVFSATYDPNFIGPIVFQETSGPVCVVQAEEMSDVAQTESNLEVCQSQEEVSQDESFSFERDAIQVDLPEIVSLFADSSATGDVELVDYFFGSRGDIGILVEGPETSATVSEVQELQFVDTRTRYSYDALETIVFIRTDDVVESIQLESPIEIEPEEGVYFNEKIGESTSERSSIDSDSPQVGMLAERQLFALISPSDFNNSTAPATAASAEAVKPDTGLPSLATRSYTPSVFGKAESHNVTSNLGSSSVGPQKLRSFGFLNATDSGNDSRTFHGVSPIGAHPMDSYVEQGAFSSAPPILPYTMLDQIFGGQADDGPVEEAPPAEQREPSSESSMHDKVARGVQIVESAIVLIGLPSSRVCRDDGSKRRTGV